MRNRILCTLTVLVVLLPGCAAGHSPAGSVAPEGGLTIVATTYPVYLFASAVTDGVEGVTVERLDTGETSCLHDYALSVGDMKKLEGAQAVALNGAGLEDFMADALAASSALVIDCSQGVELLENLAHDHAAGDEDGHGHYDPHIWMAPSNAVIMVDNLQKALTELDPDHGERYGENALSARSLLLAWDASLRDVLTQAGQREETFPIPGLITFHDGFQYFAHAFDLPLLASIEEEAGSEASAREINEITGLVKEYAIPVIFTEVNGSGATAQAISRETGCTVAQLTMVMDGPEGALSDYFDGLMGNMTAIVNGFAGEEIVR